MVFLDIHINITDDQINKTMATEIFHLTGPVVQNSNCLISRTKQELTNGSFGLTNDIKAKNKTRMMFNLFKSRDKYAENLPYVVSIQ